jgi:hypothetical protein
VTNSKAPANFVALFEGFQQFDGDLNKLQQFVEINETAMSKILKKVRYPKNHCRSIADRISGIKLQSRA